MIPPSLSSIPKSVGIHLANGAKASQSSENGHSNVGDSALAPALTPKQIADLIASERRFRTLVETAPGGFVLMNALGVASYATTSITSLMGYEMSEVIGRNLFSFVH